MANKMIRKVIFISIILFTGLGFGQTNLDTLKCNSNVLFEFQNHMDSLSIELAKDFFHTFNENCISNAEYSEWSNELLFRFLERYPNIFIRVLSSDDTFDTKYIFQNLESPVNDEIDLENIRINIKSVNSDSAVKGKILNCVKIAINKNYNRHITRKSKRLL